MIADPVFADMLSDEPSHGHSHDHDHAHASHSHSHSHPQSHSPHPQESTTILENRGESSKSSQAENDLAQDKVRSTIRSLVRDWAIEGKPERDACYTPILEALVKSFPEDGPRARRTRKVLVPGCGLGRLAMEIAALGKLLAVSPLNRLRVFGGKP